MPNKPKKVTTACKACKSEFITTAQNIKRGNGNFCSTKCRYSSFKESYECSFCKIIFVSTKARKEKSKTSNHFCSNPCKYKAASSLDNAYMTGPKIKSIGDTTYRNRAFNFLDKKCSCCNYSEYLEILDVNHIDGNRRNNDIVNLQILCVKCHALKTRLPDEFQRIYGVKINRKCKGCEAELKNNKQFYCGACNLQRANNFERKKKILWPKKEELQKLLWEMPMQNIAKIFGVSDVAISKWAKTYKIDKPPRGYWVKKTTEKNT